MTFSYSYLINEWSHMIIGNKIYITIIKFNFRGDTGEEKEMSSNCGESKGNIFDISYDDSLKLSSYWDLVPQLIDKWIWIQVTEKNHSKKWGEVKKFHELSVFLCEM